MAGRKRYSGKSRQDQQMRAGSGRAAQAMRRLSKMACALFDSRTAFVVLSRKDRTAIVCGQGLAHEHLALPVGLKASPTGRLIVNDVSSADEVGALGRLLRSFAPRFFLYAPVVHASGHRIGLVVADPQPRPAPDEEDLRMLDEIVALVAEEIGELLPLLVDPEAHVTVPMTLDALIGSIGQAPDWTALIGPDLVVMAVSQGAASLFGARPEAMIGRKLAEVGDGALTATQIFVQSALDSRMSSPDLELVRETALGGEPRTFSLVATAVSPINDPTYYVKISAHEISNRILREETIETRVAREAGGLAFEPTVEFLLESLPERRVVRTRGRVSYFTLRSWRSAVRDFQLKALKTLKRNPPVALVSRIAEEMQESLDTLVGAAAFKAVVPMPCGHSKSEDCLSVQIARSLAQRLDLPLIQAFENQRLPGSSHPKANVARPPLILRHPVSQPALLIDDIATSGAHVEEAASLLRPTAGAVLPLVWIGGETSQD